MHILEMALLFQTCSAPRSSEEFRTGLCHSSVKIQNVNTLGDFLRMLKESSLVEMPDAVSNSMCATVITRLVHADWNPYSEGNFPNSNVKGSLVIQRAHCELGSYPVR